MNLESSKIHKPTQGIEKQLSNLLQQINSFTNQVMGFNPMKLMNAADAETLNVAKRNYLMEDKFRDYSEKVLRDL